jgi:macrolide-specific efflux system membrane fusion protein
MSAQVFFVSAAAKGVPLVPMAALRPARGGEGRGRFVARVVTIDGAVEERVVTVGVTNRVAAEVKSGLSVGDQVILSASPTGARPAGGQRPARTPRLS